MSRVLKRSWLATLVCLSLLISTLVPALAAPVGPSSQDEAIEFLKLHGIVQGDEFGRINEDSNITRAELAKIAVAASGQAELAPILANAVRFADARGHWGAGYIELGARMGLLKGRDANTFDPDANISYAEVYTILLRMVGREPLGPWSPATIMQTAAELGLAPSVGAEALANLPAVRGVIFESLARAMTTLPLADGKTLAQKHFDDQPPVLSLSGSIPEATVAESVTISGTATGAKAVLVNGLQAVFQNGQFSAVVPLQPGPNEITVEAYDLAGNVASKTITVTQGGEVASIAISGPTHVNAGESITLNVVAKDAQGRTMPNSLLTATVSGGLGTFDVATGKFTAGTKAGMATITLASGSVTETYQVAILGQASEAAGLRIRPVPAGAFTVGKTGKIEVEVVDAEGNLVAYDGGRNVILSSRDSDLTVVNSVAQTVGGVATFNVTASEVGSYLVTATAIGLNSDSIDVNFASSTRIVLVPTTEGPYKADGATPVRLKVELQNEAGNPVTNTTGEAIQIELDITSDDATVTRTVTIAAGGRSAEATVIPGVDSETVTVRGIVTSGQPYSVIPVSLRFQEIQVGRPAKFEILGAGSVKRPGYPVELRVVVVDAQGNRVETGNYAFQVEITTSNDEQVIDGLPDGAYVYLGNTGFVPVEDASGGVVARTRNGAATLTLEYNKSGWVTVKVVGVRSTSEAISDNGEVGPASSGTGLRGEVTAVFTSGDPHEVELTAEIPTAKVSGLKPGVLRASPSSSIRISARILDEEGGHLPLNGESIRLERTASENPNKPATRVVGQNNYTTARFVDGVAQFTIYGTGEAGWDEWTASFDGKVATIKIYAAASQPDRPTIVDMAGYPSYTDNRVQPDDTHLLIRLDNAPDAGYAKVYRSGSSTPIFIGGLTKDEPTNYKVIKVPRDKLPTSDRYSVVVNNGHSDSPRSDVYPTDSSERVVLEAPLKVNISRVRLSATSEYELTITATASGVHSSGEIDSSKLLLVNEHTGYERRLSGAECKPSSGSFTCDLSYFNITGDRFYGNVVLKTLDGWYRRDSTGQIAPADETLSDNRVTPTPWIETVSVVKNEDGSARIYLEGSGFSGATIYPEKLSIDGTPLKGSSFRNNNSTQITFTVDKDTMGTITLTSGSRLAADAGWLDSNGKSLPIFEGVPISARVDVRSISYDDVTNTLTIHGSGFAGGQVFLENLSVVSQGGQVVLPSLECQDPTNETEVTYAPTAIQIKLCSDLAEELEAAKGTVYLRSSGTWFKIDDLAAPALPQDLMLYL